MQQSDLLTYIVGGPDINEKAIVPYSDIACDFLNELSKVLRTTKEAVAFPDVMTFAFWCRKANIQKLREEFKDGKSRLGRGIVFHIAPSNVPINFAFSFAFGLLSGNANIVRVPSKQFPQIDIICKAINNVMESDKYTKISKMTAFVRYEKNDNINQEFSSKCSARLIWGGDETIRNIRRFQIPERSIDIAFADRYSFCILDSNSVEKLNESELKKLAQDFYNDTYIMDQNACSSPQLIVWLGEKADFAREKFWKTVESLVNDKYNLEAATAVDKYTQFCHDAIQIDGISSLKNNSNLVYRIGLKSLPDRVDTLRGRCGYFYEYEIRDLMSISKIINNRYQTITYFGVNKLDLLNFVINNRLSGIDRIVPIGNGLDIGVIWDGYDIIKSLSRIIDLK